mmetsp:Transcript_11908/g.35950  ORF Transcript_11908/g.35950 Transcript_11908/m.35950 type:complete len:360 (+) Transcript_11908:105-1184(+)
MNPGEGTPRSLLPEHAASQVEAGVVACRLRDALCPRFPACRHYPRAVVLDEQVTHPVDVLECESMVGTYEKALPHHLVCTRKGRKVLAIGRVSRDVARKEHADLHVIALQEAEHPFAVMMLQWHRKPVELVMPRRENVGGARPREVLNIPVDVAPADLAEVVQLAELCQAKRSAHLARLHVVAHATIKEFEVVVNAVNAVPKPLGHVLRVVADPAPVPVHQGPVLQLRVVEHNYPTETARCDDVGGVEGDHADVRLGGVRHGVTGVLEQPDTTRNPGAKLRPVDLAARKIWHQYASGLRSYCRKDHVQTRHITVGFHVTENGREAQLQNGCHCSGKRARGGHHLVPLLQAQHGQSNDVS